MRRLHAGVNWFRQLFRSRAFDREMQAEMEAHIEQEAILNRARGMNTGESIAAARRDFGNVGYMQEQARDARGTRFIEETKRDLVYGLRSLLRTPAFTIVALLSLTLGIGVNTAMFTFGRFLFAPQQLGEPETFVTYGRWLTYPGWEAIAKQRDLFAKTVAHAEMNVALSRDGTNSTKALADLVSDGYFSMYSGRAHIGRVLVPGESSDAGAPAAAVLSYPYWRRQLAGDSNVVGKTLRLTNGLRLTIVGVANKGFKGAMPNARSADFWVPLAIRDRMPIYQRGDQRSVSPFADTKTQWLTMAAQLSEGVEPEQAALHLRNLVAHLPTADTAGINDRTRPLLGVGTRKMITRNNAPGISLALSATVMVLLIGCANVANLVLARGMRRRREIAVRLSLGATRLRLIRQLMTESAILAVVGGVCAIILSQVVMRLLSTSEWLVPLEIDSETLVSGLKPDRFVVVFTFAMAFLSAAASGLLPALRSTKIDLSRATRDDGAAIGTRQSHSRLRTGLVVGQVALSLVLLITTTVLLRSSANANESDVGFDRKNIVTTAASRSENGYTDAQYVQYGLQLQNRSALIAGAANIARGTIPFGGELDYPRVNPSEPQKKVTALATASANYFAVLGISVLRGRAFTELEARNRAPVVVVSEATAKRFWPTVDALGQRLVLADEVWSAEADSIIVKNEREMLVVGIARDAQTLTVGEIPKAMMYQPADTGSMLVRTAGSPSEIARQLTDVARNTDRDMMVKVRTLDDVIYNQGKVRGAEITSSYTGILGTFGLLLSAIGIFGVVAYAVSQRTREIGVRLAIGAQPSDVLRLMLRQGMRPVLFGIVLGVVASALITRALRVMLFGITPTDPVAYLTAVAVVTSVALVACYLPSRRATSIDPVGAIRSE